MFHVVLSVVIGFQGCSIYFYMCSPISDFCATDLSLSLSLSLSVVQVRWDSQSRLPVSEFDITEVPTLERQLEKSVTLHIKGIR